MNWILLSASIHGALAVSIGAFGAHALKSKISPDLMNVFQTASQYHFYHLIALFIVGVLYKSQESSFFVYSAISFNLGIILFSGSLYILAITGIKILGAITPIGGVSLIAAWCFLILNFIQK